MCDADVSPVQSRQRRTFFTICPFFCINKERVGTHVFDFHTSLWRRRPLAESFYYCYFLRLYSGVHFPSGGFGLVVVRHGFIVCKSLFLSPCLLFFLLNAMWFLSVFGNIRRRNSCKTRHGVG